MAMLGSPQPLFSRVGVVSKGSGSLPTLPPPSATIVLEDASSLSPLLPTLSPLVTPLNRLGTNLTSKEKVSNRAKSSSVISTDDRAWTFKRGSSAKDNRKGQVDSSLLPQTEHHDLGLKTSEGGDVPEDTVKGDRGFMHEEVGVHGEKALVKTPSKIRVKSSATVHHKEKTKVEQGRRGAKGRDPSKGESSGRSGSSKGESLGYEPLGPLKFNASYLEPPYALPGFQLETIPVSSGAPLVMLSWHVNP